MRSYRDKYTEEEIENLYRILGLLEDMRGALYQSLSDFVVILVVVPWDALGIRDLRMKHKKAEDHLGANIISIVQLIRPVYKEISRVEEGPEPIFPSEDEEFPFGEYKTLPPEMRPPIPLSSQYIYIIFNWIDQVYGRTEGLLAMIRHNLRRLEEGEPKDLDVLKLPEVQPRLKLLKDALHFTKLSQEKLEDARREFVRRIPPEFIRPVHDFYMR